MKEEKAIRLLREIAESWPSSLWLFAADSCLYIMRCGEDGKHVMDQTGGVDQDYIVDNINIPSDGGDW